MRTLLLDSDIIAYAFAARAERKYEFDPGDFARVADPIEEVTPRIAAAVNKLLDTLKADDAIVCLSDDTRNFRKAVLPTYKGHRVAVIKPEHLFPLKAWLAENYRSFIRPGLEADDVMGILATHPTLVKGEKVICSEDKDLLQIPGHVYNPTTKKMRRVTAEEGTRWHFMQMLMGDPVDGYTGIPGVGPVTAEKILARTDVPQWTAVVEAYITKGLTPQDALVQARVSKILQWTDYDYKRKEPILWQPPK